MHEGICIVTVTYGERFELLSKVISSVNNVEPVKKIIIVNNGSSDIDQSSLATTNTDIQIIHLKENTGSANGYSIGYNAALKTGLEFIFSIDDDNLPNDNCIENLVKYYYKIKEINNKQFALLALRDDRLDFNKIARGFEVNESFSLGNSFLGWELNKIPSKIIKKITSKIALNPNNQKNQVEFASVPIAPYGGLFLHRDLLKTINLPNPNFYLYCDDYDFTNQISKVGSIYLIPSSRITDIDKTWFVKENHGFIMSFLRSDSSFRVFYGIRNRVYFETRNLVDNPLIYNINKYSFLFFLFIFSILFNKQERFKLILRAISNGKKGLLGKEFFGWE